MRFPCRESSFFFYKLVLPAFHFLVLLVNPSCITVVTRCGTPPVKCQDHLTLIWEKQNEAFQVFGKSRCDGVDTRSKKHAQSQKKLNQAGFEFKTTLISELLCCHGHFHFYDFFFTFHRQRH